MANPGTLYVFLKGLTVVCERGSMLEVVLPSVPGHVYRAGTWLAEATISSGNVLRLRGVTPGEQSLSERDFAIHLPDCSLTSRGRAATLWLPRPKDILGLLCATAPPAGIVPAAGPFSPGGFVVIRNDSLAGQLRVATVQVLIYDYADENEVLLEGHPNWEPSSLGGAMSLHVVSTSDVLESEDHERETGDRLRRVIRGYPGVTFAKPVSPPNWRDTDDVNYGLTPGPAGIDGATGFKADGEHIVTDQGQFAFAQAELEDFRARTTRLGRLGRLKQERRPIEGLWNEPDMLGEETSNCVTYTIP